MTVILKVSFQQRSDDLKPCKRLLPRTMVETPLPSDPPFTTLQVTKSWAGLGMRLPFLLEQNLPTKSARRPSDCKITKQSLCLKGKDVYCLPLLDFVHSVESKVGRVN